MCRSRSFGSIRLRYRLQPARTFVVRYGVVADTQPRFAAEYHRSLADDDYASPSRVGATVARRFINRFHPSIEEQRCLRDGRTRPNPSKETTASVQGVRCERPCGLPLSITPRKTLLMLRKSMPGIAGILLSLLPVAAEVQPTFAQTITPNVSVTSSTRIGPKRLVTVPDHLASRLCSTGPCRQASIRSVTLSPSMLRRTLSSTVM